MKGNNRYKGISRIDSSTTHGWFVRAYKNKQIYTKFFGDRKHKSKHEALDKALAYHGQLMCMLEKIPSKIHQRNPVSCNKRNKTGVLGVCRTKKTSPKGKIKKYYSVTWRSKPSVQKYRLISIDKYGEAEAFRRAVELRRIMTKKAFSNAIAL